VPGAEALFSAEELSRLSRLVSDGSVAVDDLRAKVAIVVAERQNYDPSAAIAALQRLAPERTLVVDTTLHTPDSAARRVRQLLVTSDE